jgi:ABC-type branched-subunit amino acid transport system substrate-binding protein
MDNPKPQQRFRIPSPRRAYALVLGVTAAMLAVGLILPLALASSTSAEADFHRDTPTGTIGIQGQSPAADPTPSDEPSDSPSSSAPSGPLTASDVGVTADAIKVGVMLLDLSSVEPLGLGLDNFSIDLQKTAFDNYFARINDAGGINGRRVEPVYALRDPLAQSGKKSDAAICIQMSKDEQVFALIGFLYSAGPCAAIQYGVPAVAQQGVPEEQYAESDNYFTSAFPSPERTGRMWAKALVDTGVVDGHTVGLLSYADGLTENLGALAAEQELADLGHPVAMHVQLPTGGSTGDVQVAVQKMKAAGVDDVMIATPFIGVVQFTTFAAGQKYYPQYLVSDLGALAADGLIRGADKSFDGAIGFTSGAMPVGDTGESASEATCREDYNEEADGKDLAAGEESAITPICAAVDMFVAAAQAAGSDLTRASFVDAMQNLGDTEFPGVLPGSFAPGKTDFSDGLRPIRYSNSCHCYSPAGDPIAFPASDD